MMRRTLVEVMRSWNFHETWGWDYPLVAMTAARVGEPGIAIDALLMDTQKNTCLPNGHNYQDPRLTLYLPGNGGLLTAAAMMAGWDGAPDTGIPERRTLEGEVGRTEADAVAPAGPVRVNVETVNQRAACTS